MSKLILITGGARSGKSAFALKLAERNDCPSVRKAFVATAVGSDDEMRVRIERHKAEREEGFCLFEEPVKLAALMDGIIEKYDFILIDCVTLFLNNLIIEGMADEEIYNECELVLKSVKEGGSTVVAVTNEVGLGIVPDNPLARRFRDLQGRVNQMFAAESENVYMLVSGIPVKVK